MYDDWSSWSWSSVCVCWCMCDVDCSFHRPFNSVELSVPMRVASVPLVTSRVFLYPYPIPTYLAFYHHLFGVTRGRIPKTFALLWAEVVVSFTEAKADLSHLPTACYSSHDSDCPGRYFCARILSFLRSESGQHVFSFSILLPTTHRLV